MLVIYKDYTEMHGQWNINLKKISCSFAEFWFGYVTFGIIYFVHYAHCPLLQKTDTELAPIFRLSQRLTPAQFGILGKAVLSLWANHVTSATTRYGPTDWEQLHLMVFTCWVKLDRN